MRQRKTGVATCSGVRYCECGTLELGRLARARSGSCLTQFYGVGLKSTPTHDTRTGHCTTQTPSNASMCPTQYGEGSIRGTGSGGKCVLYWLAQIAMPQNCLSFEFLNAACPTAKLQSMLHRSAEYVRPWVLRGGMHIPILSWMLVTQPLAHTQALEQQSSGSSHNGRSE